MISVLIKSDVDWQTLRIPNILNNAMQWLPLVCPADCCSLVLFSTALSVNRHGHLNYFGLKWKGRRVPKRKRASPNEPPSGIQQASLLIIRSDKFDKTLPIQILQIQVGFIRNRYGFVGKCPRSNGLSGLVSTIQYISQDRKHYKANRSSYECTRYGR